MSLDKRGMTLIEVLVALFILVLCLAPVSTGLLVDKKQVESSAKNLVALQLAQGKLEEMLSIDFGHIVNIQPGTAFPEPYEAYDYTVEVADDADYPGILKIITVTVYYHAAGPAETNSVVVTGARTGR